MTNATRGLPARQWLAVASALLCVWLGVGCGEAQVRLVSSRQPAVTAGSGGAPSGGAPSGGAPSGGAPSGGAPATTESALHSSPPAPTSDFALGANRAIGQLLMSHVTGLTASSALIGRVRAGKVGSVILYRENIQTDRQLSTLTSSLQKAAREGGNPPLFIGTDQEGGPVKRLYHAPPTMSAQQMGASAAPRTVAESQGLGTARHLRALGINLDFAPVADIPTTSDNFLGERAFGRSSRQVAEGATGFAVGLARGGVAGSAKHFPGLGAAGPLDSDFSIVSIAASKAQLRAAYAPYRAMSQAGPTVAPMVMISDASYRALDATGVPAVLSKQIVHDELSAAGMGTRVTITDDLEVPLVQRYPAVAVKAVLAGEDILMFAQHEAGSELAYRQIAAAVAAGTIPQSLVLSAAAKVDRLKQAMGLTTP
jgi:beta-N-acetylhexosaminidase